MAFEIRRCNGPSDLPLIEIPDGAYFYERLSPGEIREPDHYGLFRKVRRGSAEVLVACPRREVKRGRCQVPLRVLRIRHQKASLPAVLRECASGALSKRRAKEIEAILRDTGVDLRGLGERVSVGRVVALAVLFSLLVLAVVRVVEFTREG